MTSVGVKAQDVVSMDTIDIRKYLHRPDSLQMFQSVSFNYDLVGLAQLLFSDYGQHEIGMRVNLYDKYFPAVEVGYGIASHDDDVTGLHYDTKAPYFRVGCDFNIMNQKHSDYKVFIGARYAYTSFKANISSKSVKDPVWGMPTVYDVKDEAASQHWVEALVGIDAKIWGPFHLGWTARYRQRITSNEGKTGKVWYIPGYGTSGSSHLTASFYAAIQLGRDLWKRKK